MLKVGNSEMSPGGNVDVGAGNSAGSNSHGGHVNVHGGDSISNISGSGGYGGNVYVTGGRGISKNATDSAGGGVLLKGGNSRGGKGGDVILKSGYSENLTSGHIHIYSADSGEQGGSGQIGMTTGVGILKSSGSVSIKTGDWCQWRTSF